MITTGAKFWYGVAGFGVAAIVAYVLWSDSEPLGLLVLVSLVVSAVLLGTLCVVVRDGDVPAAAAGADVVPAARTQLPAPWPALGALGAGVAAVGAAGGNALFYVGLGILAVTVIEWMVQGWAERATGDREYNFGLRNRLMLPIEAPVLALLGAGLVLLAFSRVLLALPKEGSTVVAIVVAAAILGVAALVATRPRISSGLVSSVAVVGAVALVGGGIVGAVAGEREFEEAGPEGGEERAGGEADFTITFTGDGFEPSSLEIPADQPVTIRFVNDDRQGSERSLLIQGLPGSPGTGPIGAGASSDLEITAPEGSYTFVEGSQPSAFDEGRIEATTEAVGTGGEPGADTPGDDAGQQGEDTENPDGGEQGPNDTTEVSSP